MRIFAVVLAISLAACSSPGYYVRNGDLSANPTPAERASDLTPVRLQRGSYRVTNEPLLPDGRVTVRGPGRHGTLWKSGLAVLLIGVPLQLAGSMIAIFGPPCDLTEGNPPASCRAAFGAGVGIGVLGHVMTFAVGPALMGAGAGRGPVEVQ
ncbi:MAG: hypothetical protein ACXVDD_01825 [Polyangia bacterium]